MHHGPAVSCVFSSDCEQRCEIVSAHNPERAADPCDVVALGHILMDSPSKVGARLRFGLFFVKSFYCTELKNFSAASLPFTLWHRSCISPQR
jgi:hypothetical protein